METGDLLCDANKLKSLVTDYRTYLKQALRLELAKKDWAGIIFLSSFPHILQWRHTNGSVEPWLALIPKHWWVFSAMTLGFVLLVWRQVRSA